MYIPRGGMGERESKATGQELKFEMQSKREEDFTFMSEKDLRKAQSLITPITTQTFATYRREQQPEQDVTYQEIFDWCDEFSCGHLSLYNV